MPAGQARRGDPRTSSQFLSACEDCSQICLLLWVGKQEPKASRWMVRVWVSGPDLLSNPVRVTRGSDTQRPQQQWEGPRGAGGWGGPG